MYCAARWSCGGGRVSLSGFVGELKLQPEVVILDLTDPVLELLLTVLQITNPMVLFLFAHDVPFPFKVPFHFVDSRNIRTRGLLDDIHVIVIGSYLSHAGFRR